MASGGTSSDAIPLREGDVLDGSFNSQSSWWFGIDMNESQEYLIYIKHYGDFNIALHELNNAPIGFFSFRQGIGTLLYMKGTLLKAKRIRLTRSTIYENGNFSIYIKALTAGDSYSLETPKEAVTEVWATETLNSLKHFSYLSFNVEYGSELELVLDENQYVDISDETGRGLYRRERNKNGFNYIRFTTFSTKVIAKIYSFNEEHELPIDVNYALFVPPTDIYADSPLILKVDETAMINYEVYPKNTRFKEVTFVEKKDSTTTDDCITIDSNGLITALKSGIARVSVISTYDDTVRTTIDIMVRSAAESTLQAVALDKIDFREMVLLRNGTIEK